VLENAQKIKDSIIYNKSAFPHLKYASVSESLNISDLYANDIKAHGYNKAIVLAWTNKTIKEINKQVRNRLFPNQSKSITKRENLILFEGHYADHYIPNGTFVEVTDITGAVENIAGLQFITVKLKNTDTGIKLEGVYKINLDYLENKEENKYHEKIKALWHERYKVNKKLQKSKNKKDDAYLSALKVKYAYAITTHKAQGGEWDKVYIHPEQPLGIEGKKLMYTAITRAKKELISITKF